MTYAAHPAWDIEVGDRVLLRSHLEKNYDIMRPRDLAVLQSYLDPASEIYEVWQLIMTEPVEVLAMEDVDEHRIKLVFELGDVRFGEQFRSLVVDRSERLHRLVVSGE